MTIFHAKLP